MKLGYNEPNFQSQNIHLIHKSSGIHDLGPIKLDLLACLIIVYALMYICICKGVKGKIRAIRRIKRGWINRTNVE